MSKEIVEEIRIHSIDDNVSSSSVVVKYRFCGILTRTIKSTINTIFEPKSFREEDSNISKPYKAKKVQGFIQ